MLEQQMTAFALLGAEWVLWVLVALSVLCIAVAIERVIYASMNATPAAAFRSALQNYVDGGKWCVCAYHKRVLYDVNMTTHAHTHARKTSSARMSEHCVCGCTSQASVKINKNPRG